METIVSARETITSAKAAATRKKAISVMEGNTKSVLLLAEVLWETYAYDVKVNGLLVPLWEAWGHHDWFQYVEVELGIHMTTAAKFRRMHEIYNIDLQDSFEPNAMDGMSATKLTILARVVTKKNVNAWLKKARKLSCCSLDEEVSDALYGTGKIGAVHTLAVLCTKSEQRRVRNIIQQAQTDMGIKRPGKALLTILEEWETIKNRTKRARAS
jgi:hypothetical protein